MSKNFSNTPVIPIFLVIALVLAISVFITFLFSKQSNSSLTNIDVNSKQVNQNNEDKKPPEMAIDMNKKYQAILHTGAGNITIDFFTKETPVAVNNFISLSREGFYDKTIFHRVIKDFMIQGGDPKGDGTGGPGYKFADEKITRDYKKGIVAMANSGPNTNGSQFFIMHKDYDLPKQYVIFGQVVSGLDIVDKIAEGRTTINFSGEESKPVAPVNIQSIDIISD